VEGWLSAADAAVGASCTRTETPHNFILRTVTGKERGNFLGDGANGSR